MRFELKTDQSRLSEHLSWTVLFSISTFLSVILINLSINLGRISKYYEINYLCNRVLIEKSSFNFKRLSKLTKKTNKQKMWDLCKALNRKFS